MVKKDKTRLNFWISKNEKKTIEEKAKQYNFISVSEYLRFVALNSEIKVKND